MENITKHVISAGGFIFYLDKDTNETFTVLIENNKGEFWIPKGKVENEETFFEAAVREIYEEVGFLPTDLTHIGFCFHDDYTYIEDGQHIRKELDLHVFETKSKLTINPIDKNNIASIGWYPYSEACRRINFNKRELEKAFSMLADYHKND